MSENLSVMRNEFKYYLSYDNALKLKKQLSQVLTPDAYSTDGAYRVKSLYFDSIRNVDFVEKMDGVNIRKKVRLRIYDEDAGKAKLELKAKEGIYQHKTSVFVTREEAEKLQNGDYGILLEKNSEEALRLYSIMTLGCYRPKVIVEYDRYALMYPEYNTRITFDSHVKTSEINLDVFDRNMAYNYAIEDNVVLEVKYNGKLMNFISAILKQYPLTNVSVSKYTNARQILGDFIF